MARKSSSSKYGTVAVSIHWLTALLILLLLVTGYLAQDAGDSAAKAFFLRFHLPAGMLVLALTIWRICWWMFYDRKPAPVPMPAWQEWISRAVHFLLYIAVIAMAASGIGMMALSGAGPAVFGAGAAALPDFWDYPPRMGHFVASRALAVLLVLHAGAALHHHFVKRDGLLLRMWFPGK